MTEREGTGSGTMREMADGRLAFEFDDDAAETLRALSAMRRLPQAGIVILALTEMVDASLKENAAPVAPACDILEELATRVEAGAFRDDEARLAEAIRYLAQFTTTEAVKTPEWFETQPRAIESEAGKVHIVTSGRRRRASP